jgi:hypothetical protein
LKVFLVEKIERIKEEDLCPKDLINIDVNSWFKTHGLTPGEMNGVRQFIFEEWITKKVSSIKLKEGSETFVVIIYESPNPHFLSFLKEKFSEIFCHDFYDIVLVEYKN